MAKISASNQRKSSGTQSPAARRLHVQKRTVNPRTWRRGREAPKHAPLPSAYAILRKSLRLSRQASHALAGITAIYGVAVVLLVRGFSASEDFVTLKSLLDSFMTGAFGKLQSIALQLTILFGGTATSSTPNAGIYQSILLVICSLALIWVFRQSQAKQPVSTKDAFYKGMYPLIPFIGVLCIIGIQLIPLSIGSYLYNSLIAKGIAVHGYEKGLALLIFAVLAYWSLRMVTGSLFALYVVTLPNMGPLQAVRSTKQLVTGRRLLIWRKLILLPVAIIVGTSILILPFLLFLTPFVVWVFFVLSTLWFALIHSYLYTLYRELLQ